MIATISRLFTAFALVSTLAGPAAAVEPGRKNALPEASSILTGGAISFGVVTARGEDAGIKAMFNTAWESLQGTSAMSSGWLGMLSAMMSSSKKDNLLLTLLPIQGVRVDRLDEKGDDHSATMMTVAGWPGLQLLFWNSLLNDNTGKPYPVVDVAGRNLIVRPKPGFKGVVDNKPVKGEPAAGAVARDGGSFYSFSDLETARLVWEKPVPDVGISGILKDLDQTQDTYGVILNKGGSMVRVLRWINIADTTAVEQGVGSERFNKTLEHVEHLTWMGDLINDDQINMAIKFHTDSEEAAENVASLLKDSRKVLKQRGRAAELQLVTRREDVLVDVQMVGYRRLVQAFMKKG